MRATASAALTLGRHQDGAQGAPPSDATDKWVTVFGFPPEERATVLREFQVRPRRERAVFECA
jgi:hypothetical protein